MAKALDLARRFVARRHPDADAAVLAGSRARGQEVDGSDHDVVLLFHSLPGGAWREMTLFEGQHVELFAHDLNTLAYFCREIDRPSGLPALPTMVAEGIAIWSRVSATLDAAREIAEETLRLGPPPLDEAALRARRYAITDLVGALQTGRDKHVRLAAGAALYSTLADFALRAARRWSASGKALPRALATLDAPLATDFETAFAALFAGGEAAKVQTLVDGVLAPYGGRLREGYRQDAPPEKGPP
jgi:hypothetical protein